MVKQVATLLNWDVSELITADNNTASIKPRRPECIVRNFMLRKMVMPTVRPKGRIIFKEKGKNIGNNVLSITEYSNIKVVVNYHVLMEW